MLRLPRFKWTQNKDMVDEEQDVHRVAFYLLRHYACVGTLKLVLLESGCVLPTTVHHRT